jgi:hypothetical protein
MATNEPVYDSPGFLPEADDLTREQFLTLYPELGERANELFGALEEDVNPQA